MRAEHLRAIQNRNGQGKHSQVTSVPPLPPSMLTELPPPPSSSSSLSGSSSRVAGPRPPPSWTMSHSQMAAYHARTPPPRPSYIQLCNARSSSLRTLCARLTVDRIVHCPRQVSRLSVRSKQWVLSEFGDRLTDALLRHFAGDLYGELCLREAKVSFAMLIKTFWKTVPLHQDQPHELAEDWEDTLDDSWEGEQEEEQHHYITYQHHNDYRLAPILDILGDHHPVLMTPLSAKLVMLDVSFMPQLDPSFFYLVAFTLPNLTRLIMAGSTATQEVVLLLSRELKFLVYWDIGYHTWLTSDVICRGIQWERDLKRLKTLCIVAAGADGLTGRDLVDNMREIRPRLHIEWE
ncbi:predicted protein [Lichtheimia corymbifera JMRC:FSU:9682]|uniref:Uncharacterized protein n=1 Tax=Lichtheimia corymbifera JMRC:FSU:9682 TaxID=1263082 RepID=A0A068RQY3_9FUNG|nr:predicted protein [Lichtheimia corymbifera JMRC:FSU:9682]